MTALFAFLSAMRGRLTGIAVATVATFAAISVQAADVIVVRLDQARLTRLPDRVSTIVVGNPLIADVSLQNGGLLVLTGKGYGVTNLVALDRAGTVLSEFLIQVEPASDTIVVVHRGAARESYSCTPECAPRISLGDNPGHFKNALDQTVNRTDNAQGSATASAGASSLAASAGQ